MFDLQAGAEFAAGPAAIVHHELGTAPSAVEIEVTLLLAEVEDSEFQEAELHQGVVSAAPDTVDRATELQRFDDTSGCTHRAGALQAARGTEAVEVELGEMSRWVERDVKRIRSGPGDELAVSRPVEQWRPAPTDVKGPGVRHADRAIEDNHAQYEELEEVCETSMAAGRHAREYIPGGFSSKGPAS